MDYVEATVRTFKDRFSEGEEFALKPRGGVTEKDVDAFVEQIRSHLLGKAGLKKGKK